MAGRSVSNPRSFWNKVHSRISLSDPAPPFLRPSLMNGLPGASTATVTGMSSTTNSWIASMPRSAKARTRAERIAFETR